MTIIRLHQIHEILAIAIYDPVAWVFVCLSFCLSRQQIVQKRLNGSRFCLSGDSWGPRNIVSYQMGGPYPAQWGGGFDGAFAKLL